MHSNTVVEYVIPTYQNFIISSVLQYSLHGDGCADLESRSVGAQGERGAGNGPLGAEQFRDVGLSASCGVSISTAVNIAAPPDYSVTVIVSIFDFSIAGVGSTSGEPIAQTRESA
jgi:hypothetical protein